MTTKAYPPGLYPYVCFNSTSIREIETEDDAQDDAMFQAINSSRGKALEALFSHTLREFALATKSEGTTRDLE